MRERAWRGSTRAKKKTLRSHWPSVKTYRLARAVGADDQRQGLVELDDGLILGRERADALDEHLLFRFSGGRGEREVSVVDVPMPSLSSRSLAGWLAQHQRAFSREHMVLRSLCRRGQKKWREDEGEKKGEIKKDASACSERERE